MSISKLIQANYSKNRSQAVYPGKRALQGIGNRPAARCAFYFFQSALYSGDEPEVFSNSEGNT
ncbi:hypothetical protein KDAU_16960 [Dictyobacter aurantiacus]|uniref:Uncharacterized protein n=1 Tax=Dictyobacter aurantiacus TaxID=1936993 RepID=A0A401ZBW5_9CHLR|nr:hypothetical protein KDAU_16960 [Dictyobacter aurantiacus]